MHSFFAINGWSVLMFLSCFLTQVSLIKPVGMAGQISFEVGTVTEVKGEEKVSFLLTRRFGPDYREILALKTGKGVIYKVNCIEKR